jgi:hypothetical protein
VLSEIQNPELLVIIFLSETDQQKKTPIMKIGNRRGIYSEEERAQQLPSERGSEGGNWRGRRKRARESARERG